MGIWMLVLVTVAIVWSGVAFWLAVLARSRSRLVFWLLGPIVVAGSSGGLVVLAVMSGFLRWGMGTPEAYFAEAAAMAALAGGGAIVILVRGGLMRDGGMAAGRWPVLKLLVLWLAAAAAQVGVVWMMDRSAQVYSREMGSALERRWRALVGPMPEEQDNAAALYRQAFAVSDEVLAAYTEELRQMPQEEKPAEQDGEATVKAVTEEVPSGLGFPPAVEPPPTATELLGDADLSDPRTVELARRLEPVAKLLSEASQRRACRWVAPDHVIGVLESQPEFAKLRQAVLVLRLVAQSRAAQANLSGAWEAIRAIHRVAQHVDQTSPALVGGLVRMGCHAVGYDVTVKVLGKVREVSQLPGDLPWSAEGLRERWMQNLQGEELGMLKTLHDFAAGELGEKSPIPERGAMLYRILWLRADTEAMSAYCDAAHRAFLGEREALKAMMYRGRPARGGPVAMVMMPSVERGGAVNGRIAGAAGRVTIAVALTRHRIEKGGLPQTLDELVPAYLKEIPADPVDGKPMRYRQDGEDAIVYSVGEDGRDDGGAIGEGETRTKDDGERVVGKRMTNDQAPMTKE